VPRRPAHHRVAAGVLAVVLAAGPAGCRSGDATTGSVRLAGVCPSTVVVQTDWFPGPEYGPLYQLLGDGLTIAPGKVGAELGGTGVKLEIRAGTPGGDSVAAAMYGDDSILLGAVPTDDAVRDSLDLATVAVVSPLDRSPRMLMWDPAQYSFTGLDGIAKSDARVVYAEGADDLDVLAARKLVRRDQLDPSFDGSPTTFTTEEKVIQQGLVTGDPYTYERELAEWRKPVRFALVDDSGFRPYPALAVRADKLEADAGCLKVLVPLIQQATVDFIEDPGKVDGLLPRVSQEFADFRPVSAAAGADAVARMKALKLVGNGSNGTLGDFDEARVAEVITEAVPAFAAAEPEPGVRTVKPGLTAADVVTNRFVDTSIGLGRG
jgi:hypothetical protein